MSDMPLQQRHIIGAATEERTCPTCTGKGKVIGATLIGDYCPAVYDAGNEELTCLTKGFHNGPHETYLQNPCWSCFGFDQHADWCPDIGVTTTGGFDVKFDDKGWYWAVTR